MIRMYIHTCMCVCVYGTIIEQVPDDVFGGSVFRWNLIYRRRYLLTFILKKPIYMRFDSQRSLKRRTQNDFVWIESVLILKMLNIIMKYNRDDNITLYDFYSIKYYYYLLLKGFNQFNYVYFWLCIGWKRRMLPWFIFRGNVPRWQSYYSLRGRKP